MRPGIFYTSTSAFVCIPFEALGKEEPLEPNDLDEGEAEADWLGSCDSVQGCSPAKDDDDDDVRFQFLELRCVRLGSLRP